MLQHRGYTENCISLVFKTRRTNFSGSDWQTEKQGHWTRNSVHVFVLSRDAFESEVNRTNKRQKIDQKLLLVPMSMTYNKPLTERLLSLYQMD